MSIITIMSGQQRARTEQQAEQLLIALFHDDAPQIAELMATLLRAPEPPTTALWLAEAWGHWQRAQPDQAVALVHHAINHGVANVLEASFGRFLLAQWYLAQGEPREATANWQHAYHLVGDQQIRNRLAQWWQQVEGEIGPATTPEATP